ncbi:MAG: hypothetical protein QGG36_33245 [Pirellulaceae bacterium]|jgi:hypothetical protein|nr:hypothetical protein [Pirellulaceae bacterium]MDP7020700.1 hypothetical protein [Pirellulaceae bacterium]
MKLSLSNIFLLIVVAGVATGWYVDRQKLIADNEKLNEEATDLFNRWSLAATPQSGFAVPGSSTGAPTTRVYSHDKAADRAAFIRDYEKSRQSFLQPTWLFEESGDDDGGEDGSAGGR